MKTSMTWGVVALILAMTPLAGCGGSGGNETAGVSTDNGTSHDTATGTTGSSKQAKTGEGASGKENDSSEERGSGGSKSSALKVSGPAPTPHGSLPNEGTKETAPGVPIAKGGDNSIQEFGVEASSSDRIEATQVVKDYLDARAAGDWAQACARVSSGFEVEIGHFSGAATQQGLPSCEDALQALTVEVPKSNLRIAADIRVLSMRAEGTSAWLIYRNGENTPFSFPVARESGEWRVTALDGSALVLGPDDF